MVDLVAFKLIHLSLINDFAICSYSRLKDRVKSLSEGGSTALGPALAIGVGMLAKQPGSEVVLCTDGMPNQGVGSLERYGNRGNDPNFYTRVRTIAIILTALILLAVYWLKKRMHTKF